MLQALDNSMSHHRGLSPESQPERCGARFPAGSWGSLLEPALVSWPSSMPFLPSCPSSSSSSSPSTRCIQDTGSRETLGEQAGDDSPGSWTNARTRRLEGTADRSAGLISAGVQLCYSCFQLTVAHQDERRELSGGQSNSIWAVDPQQVVGGHVQVMVSMGGGKHAHLKEQRPQ